MDEELSNTHPEPVDYLELPPKEGREAALKERRQFSKELAEAAATIKSLSTEREALTSEVSNLKQDKYIDVVTGLPNRAMFEEKLPLLFNLAQSSKAPLAFMMIDVNGLKRTNDSEGYPTGNKLLGLVGKVLEGVLRPEDIAGRLGGDEFYGLMPGYEPMPNQTIEELNADREQRLKNKFDELALELGIPPELHVGIEVGIAVLLPEDTIESFVERADKELHAKKGGHYISLAEQGIIFKDDRLDAAAKS